MSTQPEGKVSRIWQRPLQPRRKQVPVVSGGPWRRQVRTWEALAGLGTVIAFFVAFFVQPITTARDEGRDAKAALTLLAKTVTDHENRLHKVEDHNIVFDELKDSRGKRLMDVEEASKANTLEINRHAGALIQLQTGQTILQKSVDDGNRKLDDLLSSRKR